MKSHRNFLKYCFKYAAILCALCFISSCEDFTRFSQEKYQCGDNSTKISEVVLEKLNVGSKVKILFENQNIQSDIKSVDDEKIKFYIFDSKVLIDRNKNEMLVKVGDQITSINCKKSVFKM